MATLKQNQTQGEIEFPRFYVIESKNKEKKIANLSPFIVEKVLKGYIGEDRNCSKLRQGGLLVEVHRKAQGENLLKQKKFHDIEISVSVHRSLNSCKGVVQSWDLAEMTEDEIQEEMKGAGIVNVSHILKWKDGNRVPSGSMILTFGSSTLPAKIKAGYLSLKVRPYIPNPLRCFKCQRYGHHSNACTREEVCPKCGKLKHE